VGSRAEAVSELAAGVDLVHAFARSHANFLPASMLERFILLAKLYDNVMYSLRTEHQDAAPPCCDDICLALIKVFGAAFECAPACVLDRRLGAINTLVEAYRMFAFSSLTTPGCPTLNAFYGMLNAACGKLRDPALRSLMRHDVTREGVRSFIPLWAPHIFPEFQRLLKEGSPDVSVAVFCHFRACRICFCGFSSDVSRP
jgi:hypothetical protein